MTALSPLVRARAIIARSALRLLASFLLAALLPGLARATPPGAVVAWGAGEPGASGHPNYGQSAVPASATGGVIAIAAGPYFSVALKSTGSVIIWGYNASPGVLSVPPALNGVTAIATSPDSRHILALRNTGTLVAWGRNDQGQLTGTPDPSITVATLVAPGGQTLTDVVGMATGSDHSIAVKSNGTVVAWGWNGFGQINVAAGLSGVVAVAAGYNHNLALKSDGTIVAWGDNTYGQSTVPAGLSNVVAIAAANHYSMALKSDGTVLAWGWNYYGPVTVPPGLSDVVAIAAGVGHSLALKSDGTIVAWGDNADGQTTIPPAAQSCVLAIAAGHKHSLALVTAPPAILTPPASQTRLAGQTATFTVTVAGTPPYTYQWYKDGIPLPGATAATLTVPSVTAASAGDYTVEVGNCAADTMSDPTHLTVHAAASPGEVFAWGDNAFGQTDVPQLARSGVIAIAAGQGHTLALKSDGHLIGWGWNTFGQASVPFSIVNGAVAIAAGQSHSLALKYDGTVIAWGNNADGQCNVPPGLSGVTAISAGGAHSVALKSDGTLVVWGVGTGPFGYNLPPAGLDDVTAIAAGMYHTLALKSDGTVVAWGGNLYGESTVPPNLAGVTAIAAGFYHSTALLADGSIVAWGAGATNTGTAPDLGQSAVPPGLANGLALSAGRHHTVVLKNDRTLAAWGDDSAGQTTVPATVQGRALAIAAGWAHTVAILGRKPLVLSGPYTVYANLGQNVIFHVDVDGTPPLDVSWSRRSVAGPSPIPGATETTLRLTDVTFAAGSTYTVTVSNAFGAATASATLTVLPATTLDQWRASRFTAEELENPAISGPLADPTGTGTPNLLKYAFNLEPVANAGGAGGPSVTPPSSWPLQPVFSDDALKLVFQAIRPDLAYTVEASTDLAEWSEEDVTIEANGTERTATFAPPVPARRAFLRVVVSLPSP